MMHTHINKWLRFVLVATVATCAGCVTVIPPEQEFLGWENSINHENWELGYGFSRIIIKEW